MPIYEYECKECNNVFEEMRSFKTADIPVECSKCKSSQTKRILSNFFSTSSSGSASSNRSSCGSCSGGNCSSCH